jgi:STE24 endopeptidase
MQHWFFWLFVSLYALHLAVEWTLDFLNWRALNRRPAEIPPVYRATFTEEDYRKSVAYTRSKMRFGWSKGIFDVAVLWTLILTGGFHRLDQLLSRWLPPESLAHLVAYPFLLGGILYLLSLPFSVYFQFVLEEKYGFNRMKPLTFLGDQIKTILLALVLGAPLLALLFWLVEKIGPFWWLAGWGVMLAVQFLSAALFPVLFAPLFYKFTPLPDGELKEKITQLAQKVRFKMAGIFTIDGSRRSTHSNAFFAGIGKTRRIVLFDTLAKNLAIPEIVAVLAHEMGHNVKRHIQQSLILSAASSLAGFYVLARLLNWKPFFTAFGVPEPNLAVGFVLFGLVSAVFTFPFNPLMKWFSRKNEYEADRFSAEVTGDKAVMTSGLLKLSKDNLSNLTPHPWYSFYHYSHPTTAERAAALEKIGR